MNDTKTKSFTADEKIELLGGAVANIMLFLKSKYPDFEEESRIARKKYNEKDDE